MSTTLDTIQVKAIFKEAMLELFQERRDEFTELLVEALEDIGLVHAIDAGRVGDYVSRDEIMAVLEREP